MKRSFGMIAVCLFLLFVPQIYAAGEVSSTAISLDLAAGSVEIYESEGVTYCVQNGETQATTGGVIIRQTDNATATANTITVTGGSCKVTISSLNIEAEDKESPIFVEEGASLDLTLLGSSTVTGGHSSAGIQVPESASITIDGSGSITVTGGYDSAGIGGGFGGWDGGTIIQSGYGIVTINGGTVTATGGSQGEGIGGGYRNTGGIITINGGTVNATGGSYGAGIGGFYSDVTISGGTVTATGGSRSAGIGGSYSTVTICGGTVTATGGYESAGIGGGSYSDTITVTINGGTVTATGGSWGAGIGSGRGGDGDTVTISGGTVTATGGTYEMENEKGADIGAGFGGTFDAVTISEYATVTNGKGDAPDIVETIFIDNQPAIPIASRLGNTPAASVIAHNHSGLTYQWQISSDNKNWSDVEGETTSTTASFAMTEELDGAYLRCKLTNGWGNVQYTDAVQIYVLAFAQQPVSVEANLNDMVAFEALSTCSNVAYQWQRSYDEGATWSNVNGETFSTLIVNATLSESSAKYRCVITATNGDWLASDVVSVNLDLGELVTYTMQDFLQNTDGSGYIMEDQEIFQGLSGETVTAADKECDGFTLNTGKSTLSGTVAEDNSLVLTRYFDRNTYSITFDTNGGGALPKLEALYGADIDAPSAPSRYGHTFAGWYADEDLTEAYTFDTMPLGGATVYAKWMPVGADRGVEYIINDLAIRDSSTFELLDDIPDGQFLVEVSVTNLESTQVDTVLLAYYTNRGQMIGMQYLFANTPVGYTTTFGASVDNSNGDIGRITAFVLPSLGNPIPLAQSVTIQ